MKVTIHSPNDTLGRIALWFYVAKRLLTVFVLGAIVLLAALLILMQFARQWLIGLGA